MTPEERATLIRQCDYDQWPDELKKFSFDTVQVPLTDGEVEFLLYAFESVNGPHDEAKIKRLGDANHPGLMEKFAVALKQFPEGCYVKLSSRGPKDSWYGHLEGFKCLTPEHVFALLTDSERIFEDLGGMFDVKRPPILLFRKWLDFPVSYEFRCFHYKGKLVGVSQYDYNKYFEHITTPEFSSWIKEAVGLIHSMIKGHLPESVIFDVCVPKKGLEGFEWTLIEINPWLHSPFGTDPCLADWDELESYQGNDAVPYDEPLYYYRKDPVVKPDIEKLVGGQ